MNEQELLYTIALTRVLPYQSQVQQTLLDTMGSATALATAGTALHDAFPQITERLERHIAQIPEHLARAEQEIEFARKNHIRIIHRDDADYPARLRECSDAPILLYYRGSVDLNSRRILSIVGTRKASEYGRTFCQRFLTDLARLCPDVLVISGLAYGIDICAHRQSLSNGLSTIGVLAHGLDQIYPRMHRQTAIEMLTQGGLLTEFMSQSTAEKVNFVARNRIVAGMADATLVVESAEHGGSLITAGIANDYNRDVFAVPGRIGDNFSVGCNNIIRDNKAILLTSAEDFVKAMGWENDAMRIEAQRNGIERELFPDLSPEQKKIYDILNATNDLSLNILSVKAAIPIGNLSAIMFQMEMMGVVKPYAGGTYHLLK